MSDHRPSAAGTLVEERGPAASHAEPVDVESPIDTALIAPAPTAWRPPPPSPPPPPPPVERARATGIQFAIGVAVAMAMVAFAAAAGGVLIGKQLVDRSGAPPAVASRQPIEVAAPRTDLPRIDVAAVSAAVEPSVVTVSADLGGGDGAGESVGSGIITTSDGEIVTNAHVVATATEIRVRLAGETEPRAARLVAIDTGNDLALLRIAGSGFPAARFADPGSIGVGDEVVAIGFALDLDGQASITLGIVSALDRTVLTDHGALDGLLQTDAAISSGNSGGPLVNGAGEVVGINTAVLMGGSSTAASNIGLAIANAEALPVMESLREHSTGTLRVEAYIGLGLEDRVDGGGGALVTNVESGAPAGHGGVEEGDILIEVDGTPVEGAAGAIAAVKDRQPGDQVVVVVLRGGDSHRLDVVLATNPEG